MRLNAAEYGGIRVPWSAGWSQTMRTVTQALLDEALQEHRPEHSQLRRLWGEVWNAAAAE